MKNWEFHYELRPKAGAVNRAMCGLGFQGGRGSQTVIGLALKALVRCLGSFFQCKLTNLKSTFLAALVTMRFL
uniref:Uncharacterized protein n=1 Tax=Picea glauca TaxID=3330 RepID=A0A101M0X6_PICGL|nr:hypothetical protein ABT39_MTgene4248 [Picea glauca]QHR89555.1 hypothetical protein Q903MT_gene3577 [Picea sitchensis]